MSDDCGEGASCLDSVGGRQGTIQPSLSERRATHTAIVVIRLPTPLLPLSPPSAVLLGAMLMVMMMVVVIVEEAHAQ